MPFWCYCIYFSLNKIGTSVTTTTTTKPPPTATIHAVLCIICKIIKLEISKKVAIALDFLFIFVANAILLHKVAAAFLKSFVTRDIVYVHGDNIVNHSYGAIGVLCIMNYANF